MNTNDDEEKEVKAKNIAVRIVKQGEKQSVVEWLVDGNPNRVTVRNSAIKDMAVKENDLKNGTPYGLDFKDILKSLPTAESVERTFHEYSVWTAEDVKLHPDWVLAALSSIYSPILRALMEYIKVKKI